MLLLAAVLAAQALEPWMNAAKADAMLVARDQWRQCVIGMATKLAHGRDSAEAIAIAATYQCRDRAVPFQSAAAAFIADARMYPSERMDWASKSRDEQDAINRSAAISAVVLARMRRK